MEYEVIFYGDLAAVVSIVNARLKEGWKPCGGIAVVTQPREETSEGSSKTIHYFCQAIVKPTESDS